MDGKPRDERIVRELEAALDTDDPQEKNFHIRQALQLVNLD